ncbi:hypothetical protein B1B04_24885 [Lysinibacillus sp. KCTC 33748]|uniref:hypothetical protein n=1 Tax=unclassified Lysinibacillus TaxID=2636778 RepID=UPI0009A90017|nr:MULTISPECIES: hypothetical protein [unclassified Lysinibacillus]OXS65746.1 hypothetical protein B1B04_24885 [Lysinibacillus sp. KCTC 33748]SKC19415.1 hypothetical protein SAMN06295926_14311 [Lysinibacillus sp. AC-3]
MKRFWLNLPDINDHLEITTSNNKLSLLESSNEKVYTIDVGKYSLEKLKDNLVNKGLDARIGEIKSPKNTKLIVLFLDNSFTNVNGSFITFIGGIESIDTGDRQEESIIHI